MKFQANFVNSYLKRLFSNWVVNIGQIYKFDRNKSYTVVFKILTKIPVNNTLV